MLPYHVAAARKNYVKSIVWFVDQRTKFNVVTQEQPEAGGFVIKREGGDVSGISPDYAFETELMADLKGQGGLTQRRGMDEVT